MKKKLLTALFAITCVLCLAFGMSACSLFDGMFNSNNNGDNSGDKMWLNEHSLSLNVGDSVTLYVEVLFLAPEDYKYFGIIDPDGFAKECENKGLKVEEVLAESIYVEWSSEDSLVAEVDKDGNVTALSAGTTTIHAWSYYELFHASCSIYVSDPDKTPGKPETPENPDKPDIGDQPEAPVTSELVFEFYDAESSDGYPYLNAMITGNRGSTVTLKPDGTVAAKAGSITLNGTYVKNGNVFSITLSGSTAEYILDGDYLSSEAVMSGYHVKLVYKLKTADSEPVYTELAGKSFAFANITSTLLDESTLNSLRLGYKNATITFYASGLVEIYNPGDSIDTEPNAYSLQRGNFSCENGEGYVTITAMTSGGEPVRDFVDANYTLSFDGATLTLSAAEMTFTYTLVTG